MQVMFRIHNLPRVTAANNASPALLSDKLQETPSYAKWKFRGSDATANSPKSKSKLYFLKWLFQRIIADHYWSLL